MKPAWTNFRLSRWSRRLFKVLSFAVASFFLAISLMLPVNSAVHSVVPPSGGELPQTIDSLLAQNIDTSGNSDFFFETRNFTVSVHPRNASNLMNVMNRTAGQLEQNNAPVSYRGSINNDGWVSFDSFGSRDGRNVIYRASGNRSTRQARLEILDASTLQPRITENSISISQINIPEGTTGPGTGQDLRNTVVSFDTQNYAVRVFNDGGVRKLNVYNKNSQQQVVNGQPASLESPGAPPYECWVNYFGGSSFNGSAARYFVRVSGRNEAILEVIDANGSVLLEEPRTPSAPLVTNIPANDIPQCFGGSGAGTSPAALAPFIAAVFGDQTDLQQVQQVLRPGTGSRNIGGISCSVDPRFEDARQGRFINAAECNSRDDAAAVVSFLRGRGFNARLVYRNFRYR